MRIGFQRNWWEAVDARQMIVLGLFVLFVGAGFLSGQVVAKARVVEAEAFVLRDGNGKIRGKLYIRDNSPGLGLYDRNGIVRADLGLAPDGSPAICLYDDKGIGRITLTQGFGDSWWLEFNTGGGKERLQMGVDFKGVPHLIASDDSGDKEILPSSVPSAP